MLSKNKSFFNTKNLSLGLILLALSSYAGKTCTLSPSQNLLADTTFTGMFNVDPLPQIQADINNGAFVNIQDSKTGNTPLLNLLLTAQDGPVNFDNNYQTLLNDINYLLSVPGINPKLTNNTPINSLAAANNLWTTLYNRFAINYPAAKINASPPMINISIIIRKVANAILEYDIANSPLGVVLQDISNKAEINAYGTTPGTATTPQNLNSKGQTSLSQAVLAANSASNNNKEPNTGQASAFAIIYNLLTMTYNNGVTLRLDNQTLTTPDNIGMTALMYAAKSTNTALDLNVGETSGQPNGPINKQAINLEIIEALLGRYTQQSTTNDFNVAININQQNLKDSNKTALDYANASTASNKPLIISAIKNAGGTSGSAGLGAKSNMLGSVAPVANTKTASIATAKRKNKRANIKSTAAKPSVAVTAK
jgi:hypothetical protein